MAQTGPTEKEQNNVRGVKKLPPRMDRPSPYGVRWTCETVENNEVRTVRPKEFFKTEKARDDRYDDLLRKARRGEIAVELTRAQKEEYRAFKLAIGDTPWTDVVAGWREFMHLSGRTTCRLTVAEAVKEYLAFVTERQTHPERAVSTGYFCHVKQKVGDFGAAFGANLLGAVGPEDIEEWVDEMGYSSNHTFNNYVKHVSNLFSYFSKQVRNPCDDVEMRAENQDAVRTISVQDTARLFLFAQQNYPEALGRLALEAFAGMRFSSAFRLVKKDINFTDRGITMPAHKHKVGMQTGRQFYIDGLPDNLWAWLDVANEDGWLLENSQWMHLKSKLFNESGVPHPKNCLRHNFCTYHVAAFKNPGLTATILTHRNQQKLWGTYNGRATQADGKLYFEITPQTCAKMAGAGS